MISIIIPAHNEEALLGRTLDTLNVALKTLREPFEVIVVDDASTDGTSTIARQRGAAVTRTDRRQIAASRNAGAKSARGDVLVFVDADTHVAAETLRAAVDAVRRGAIGGGARFRTDPDSPFWLRRLTGLVSFTMRVTRWAAGCFLYVRRDAFEAVGGFDERYFAAEEIVLSRALKRRGRMVIIGPPVVTSGRKARLYGSWRVARMGLHLLWGGRSAVQQREGLELWYDGKR